MDKSLLKSLMETIPSGRTVLSTPLMLKRVEAIRSIRQSIANGIYDPEIIAENIPSDLLLNDDLDIDELIQNELELKYERDEYYGNR